MQLEQFIDVDKFTAEVEEGLNDVTEAMRTQTARAAYYGIRHANAMRQRDKVGLLVKAIDAKLTKKARQDLTREANEEAEQSGKKPVTVTVDMVKASVALHPDMLKWSQVQLEADEIERICRVAMEAFRTRSSMIVSMTNLTRDQMKSQIQHQTAREASSGYDARRAARGGGARIGAQEVSAEQ